MSEQDDPVITMADARRAFCVLGVKRWLEAREVDFKSFLENGIARSELYAMGEQGIADRLLEMRPPPAQEPDVPADLNSGVDVDG